MKKKGFPALMAALSLTLALFAGCNNDPPPPLFMKFNSTALTANTWADGDITLGGEQWFKFTATASTQYIHINDGTLYHLSVQVYDSYGAEVRFTDAGGLAVTAGRIYYIQVISYYSRGTYKIAFNNSIFPPGVITLTADTWADGNITSGGEQWFKFTATASTQYIHINDGALDRLSVQAYDSSGATVRFTDAGGLAVKAGQECYIRVTSWGSGTYKIAFNASETAP